MACNRDDTTDNLVRCAPQCLHVVVPWQSGPIVVPEGLPTKLHMAKYIATEQTRRTSLVLSATVRYGIGCKRLHMHHQLHDSGGLHVGAAVGLFVGTRELLAVYRNVQDAGNTVAAATLTGGLYGMLGAHSAWLGACTHKTATVKGNLPSRLRSAGLMAALGGVAGYPVALLHDSIAQLEERPAEERPAESTPSGADSAAVPLPPQPAHDKVDAMVAAMLASVEGAKDNGAAPGNARRWWPWRQQPD